MTDGERLAKRVAALVPCSRSDAERYIEGGWVRVGGVVVQEPHFRVQRQVVSVAPEARLQDLPPATLVLHKPAGWLDGTPSPSAQRNRAAQAPTRSARTPIPNATALLTSAHCYAGRDRAAPTVLQRHFKNQQSLVALEDGASGLLVFTQDWRVARKLNDDQAFLEHETMVDISTGVTDATLQALGRLLTSDPDLPTTKVSLSSRADEHSTLRFAVKGSHVGLLAYLCDQVQLPIAGMRRIRLGRIALSDLPVGQWRYLGINERI